MSQTAANPIWWPTIVPIQSSVSLPTNLPSLTTIFTPPASCSTTWYLSRSQTISYHGESGNTAYKVSEEVVEYLVHRKIVNKEDDDKINEQDLACQPKNGERRFSPGICPQGYTVDVVTAVASGEGTTYLGSCCPIGMSFGPTATQSQGQPQDSLNPIPCYRNVSSKIRALEPYTHNSDPSSVFWRLTIDNKVLDNATTISTGIAVADAYEVAWNMQDMDTFPTRYASSLARKADMTWRRSSSTPAPGSSPNSPEDTGSTSRETSSGRNSSGGLTTGAKVGIVIGVIAAALIGALFVFFCIKRRKQRKDRKVDTIAPTEDTLPQEMEDQDQDLATRKWYLGGKWRNELTVPEDPREMDGGTVNTTAPAAAPGPGVGAGSTPPAELSAEHR